MNWTGPLSSSLSAGASAGEGQHCCSCGLELGWCRSGTDPFDRSLLLDQLTHLVGTCWQSWPRPRHWEIYHCRGLQGALAKQKFLVIFIHRWKLPVMCVHRVYALHNKQNKLGLGFAVVFLLEPSAKICWNRLFPEELKSIFSIWNALSSHSLSCKDPVRFRWMLAWCVAEIKKHFPECV